MAGHPPANLPPDDEPALTMPPETARIVRLYLERVAMRIERISASPNYTTAYRAAARLVRDAKPD